MKKLLLSLAIAVTALCTQAQVVSIPDPNFLAALIKKGVDTNNDGQIQTSEALAVTSLNVDSSSISDLTGIEAFKNLTSLDCSFNRLTTLDMSKDSSLYTLDCSSNNLTTLNIPINYSLSALDCSSNNLTVLDLFYNSSIEVLDCHSNQLTYLDVSTNGLFGNQGLTYLNCASNPSLTQICVNPSQLGTAASAWMKDNTASWSTTCSNIVYTPDDAFYYALVDNFSQVIDTNHDGQIQKSEALAVTNLSFGSSDISDITGIEAFTNLDSLHCGVGDNLTTLDLSKNTALTVLYCNDNNLITLDFSKNTALTVLYCEYNQLTTLNVSKNTALTNLYCNDNNFTTLDLSKDTALTYLDCSWNQLAKLDVSKNTALNTLYSISNSRPIQICVSPNAPINVFWKDSASYVSTTCNPLDTPIYIRDYHLKNALLFAGADANNDGVIVVSEAEAVTSLNVSNSSVTSLTGIAAFTNLNYLNVSNNDLDSLDLSQLTQLDSINCSNNQLVYLNVDSTVLVNERLAGTSASTLLSLNVSNNNLHSLDVSKETALATLIANGNPDLPIICINSGQTSMTGSWTKDAAASYSTTCNTITGVGDNNPQLPATSPTLVGVYTPLGQQIDPSQATNGLYLFKYSDGSCKKVMVQQ